MLANDGLFAFYVNSPVLTAGAAIAMAEASGHTTNVPLVFIPEVGAPHRLDTDAV